MPVLVHRLPQVLHALPGRLRVHLPAWSGADSAHLARRLSQLTGVVQAKANGRTRNVLVHFEPTHIGSEALLEALACLQAELALRLPGNQRGGLALPVVRGVAQGVVAHAVLDTLLYGATIWAYAAGWTWVGHVGVLHFFVDLFVWTVTLHPLVQAWRQRDEGELGARVGLQVA